MGEFESQKNFDLATSNYIVPYVGGGFVYDGAVKACCFMGKGALYPFFRIRGLRHAKRGCGQNGFTFCHSPFYCHDSNQIDPLHTLEAAHGIDHDDALDALWIVDLQVDGKILAPLLAPAAIIKVIRLDLDAADAQMQPLQAIVDP